MRIDPGAPIVLEKIRQLEEARQRAEDQRDRLRAEVFRLRVLLQQSVPRRVAKETLEVMIASCEAGIKRIEQK